MKGPVAKFRIEQSKVFVEKHPPPGFGKSKYPIVNTNKSWFSSPPTFRDRSKF